MAAPGSIPSRRRSRPLRLLVIGAPLALILLVAVAVGGRWWLDGYLRSDDFRHRLERGIGQSLHADVRLGALRWEGGEVYTPTLEATGGAGSPVAALGGEGVRARLNLRALWRRVWRVDSVTCERLKITLPAAAPTERRPRIDPDTPKTPAPKRGLLARWLPDQVEVGEVGVTYFSIFWPGPSRRAGGSFTGVRVRAQPLSGVRDWQFDGEGGRWAQAGFPDIRLETIRLRTTPQAVFLTRAVGRVEGGGQVELSGRQELGGPRTLDLTAEFSAVPVEQFLPEDWRARLSGPVSGQLHVTGETDDPASWHALGHLELREGRLEALPFLNELAILTSTAGFRQMRLQSGQADFDWTPSRLVVSSLTLESAGLLRIEDGFTVRDGQIDGRLQLGVARSATRWLAGVGARVFDQPERGGYAWTFVRLSGPVNRPREDLTPRLVGAVQQQAVDKVKEGADAVRDAAGSLLDLLRGK